MYDFRLFTQFQLTNRDTHKTDKRVLSQTMNSIPFDICAINRAYVSINSSKISTAIHLGKLTLISAI